MSDVTDFLLHCDAALGFGLVLLQLADGAMVLKASTASRPCPLNPFGTWLEARLGLRHALWGEALACAAANGVMLIWAGFPPNPAKAALVAALYAGAAYFGARLVYLRRRAG